MQTSLVALSEDTLFAILRACSLQDAAHLCITATAVHDLISPLLPRLCDADDLQLIIEDSLQDSLGARHPRPQQRVWWGLSYTEAGSPCEVVISTSACKARYRLVDIYPEDQELCLPYTEGPFAGHGCVPYLSLHMDNTNGVLHSISKYIVRRASPLFTSVKAKHAEDSDLRRDVASRPFLWLQL